VNKHHFKNLFSLSLSHAKYTVFIFRPSKSYTVLNNCRRIYIYLLYILSQYLQVIHFSRWSFSQKTDSYNSILSRSAAFGVFRVKNVFIWIWRKKIIKKIIWSTEIWKKNGLSYYLTCLRVIIKRFKTIQKKIYKNTTWVNTKEIHLYKSTGRHNAMPCSIQSKSRSRYHTLIFSLCTILFLLEWISFVWALCICHFSVTVVN